LEMLDLPPRYSRKIIDDGLAGAVDARHTPSNVGDHDLARGRSPHRANARKLTGPLAGPSQVPEQVAVRSEPARLGFTQVADEESSPRVERDSGLDHDDIASFLQLDRGADPFQMSRAACILWERLRAGSGLGAHELACEPRGLPWTFVTPQATQG